MKQLTVLQYKDYKVFKNNEISQGNNTSQWIKRYNIYESNTTDPSIKFTSNTSQIAILIWFETSASLLSAIFVV